MRHQLFHAKSVLLLLALCLFCIVGCNRGVRMVQVRGKVLNKDGTVPQGGVREIMFEPAQDTNAVLRKTAVGQIEDDGSFELFTRKPGDGVIPGKYAVTISIIKAPRDPVLLIEEKYTTSATTPYHVAVEDDMDDLLFEVEPRRPR